MPAIHPADESAASDRDLRDAGILPPIAPRLIVDERHYYRGTWDREPEAVCRIRIFDAPGAPPVIVCTELPDNPSTSITTMAEYIAAEVITKHIPHRLEELIPCLWIEHYPAGGRPPLRRNHRPSFSHVVFTTWRPSVAWHAGAQRVHLGIPAWAHMPLAEVVALIGDPAILEE